MAGFWPLTGVLRKVGKDFGERPLDPLHGTAYGICGIAGSGAGHNGLQGIPDVVVQKSDGFKAFDFLFALPAGRCCKVLHEDSGYDSGDEGAHYADAIFVQVAVVDGPLDRESDQEND